MLNKSALVFLVVTVLSLTAWDEVKALTCERVASTCSENGGVLKSYTKYDLNGNAVGTYNHYHAEECISQEEEWECGTSELESTCTPEETDGCVLAETEETEYNADGEPIAFNQTWVCEQDAVTTCEPDTVTIAELEDDDFCVKQTDVCNEEVGGYCIDQDVTYQCQKPSEPCVTEGDGESCTLEDASCVSEVTNDGKTVCVTEEQTWECSKESSVCTEVGVVNSCDPSQTAGLEDHTQEDHSRALADLATGMQVAKAIENNISGTPPKVFGGASTYCTRDLMGRIGWGENCCSLDTVTGDGGALDQCTPMEEALATARRGGRTRFIVEADHIRQYIDLAVGGFCGITEKKRQYYCSFDSMIARIIQEQGRDQLNQMSSNSTPAGEGVLSFSYLDEGEGVWESLSVADVTLQAFSYPAVCESQSPSEDSRCPDNLAFKVKFKSEGDVLERKIQASSSELVAIDKHTVLHPGQHGSFCDMSLQSPSFGSCEVALKKYGENAGETFTPIIIAKNRFATADGWSSSIYGGDDWEFQVWQKAFENKAIPDDTPFLVRWAKNGSAWTEVSLPSPLGPEENIELGGEAPVYGSCVNGECRYTVRVPLSTTVKPWITDYWERQHGCEERYATDCTGFSISEFQMLDIGAMDLSEFEASVQDKVREDVPDADEYESTAAGPATNGAANANAGTQSDIGDNDTDPSASYHAAWLEDGRILTSATARAFATVNWPRNDSATPVASARVDWGDGTSISMSVSGDRYSASHQYAAAGEYRVLVTQTTANGTEHIKKLSITVEEASSPVPGLGGSPF